MIYVRLGDLCVINSGGTPRRNNESYWKNGDVPWVKISDLKNGIVESTEEFITLDGLNNSSAKIFPKGTLLYTIFATIGEVAILKMDAATNQAIVGIQLKENKKVYLKYIYYYLKSQTNNIKQLGRGVAQNNINLSVVKNMIIPIVSLEKQSNIIATLNKLEKIKGNRITILNCLDDLIKSRFVEIFGAFNINCNNYNTIKFKDLIEQNNINEEDMVWLLNLDMIKPNTGEIIEKVYINRQNIPTSSISFNNGTVLYSKLRPYLNKVVIADENGYGTSELIPLNSYKNGLTAEYLAYYLRQDSFVEYIKDKVTGAKMPRVAMDILRNIDIIKPNYISQEQFSSFVNHINKLKSDVQKSIDEPQLLMDSLMQEYFG